MVLLFLFSTASALQAQHNFSNIIRKNAYCLNGKWQIIIDHFNAGSGWKPIWKDQQPTGKYDFYEYAFTDSLLLDVPGDWDHQTKELKYYEGTIWYKKTFSYAVKKEKKVWLHFGAVNYDCDVYVNGRHAGSHEGGFTSFQFDITDKLVNNTNSIIVRVNNQRKTTNIPALNYDWWNYGGITREVCIIETPENYIADFSLQLSKNKSNELSGWIQLEGAQKKLHTVTLDIPELHISKMLMADANGTAHFQIAAKPQLWQPGNPKLYDVIIKTNEDTIRDEVGFRTIRVSGETILLNDQPIFLKGINIHEEISKEERRAWSATDAGQLLSEAKKLGCNFVRLTHYPHNEYMVRLADKMGIMLWEEIPLWQRIAFDDTAVVQKADTMLKEMIRRDKNRCSIIFWSMSNETSPSPARNSAIAGMASFARSLDSTRLITSAINDAHTEGTKIIINDPLCNDLDVIGINEYLGWYVPWPAAPNELQWQNPFKKPVIMSEFGGEALYGNHGSPDSNGQWAEERQEQIYKEQVMMFEHIPFLAGTCPWILADFRSETRMNPTYQQGWNRKGLLSDKWERKKAWGVMHKFYEKK